MAPQGQPRHRTVLRRCAGPGWPMGLATWSAWTTVYGAATAPTRGVFVAPPPRASWPTSHGCPRPMHRPQARPARASQAQQGPTAVAQSSVGSVTQRVCATSAGGHAGVQKQSVEITVVGGRARRPMLDPLSQAPPACPQGPTAWPRRASHATGRCYGCVLAKGGPWDPPQGRPGPPSTVLPRHPPPDP